MGHSGSRRVKSTSDLFIYQTDVSKMYYGVHRTKHSGKRTPVRNSIKEVIEDAGMGRWGV